ncbi:MAG TPA: DUF6345 domain-containing protein [Myxococcota bacterium]|jgi:hypothetical protein|nr:DUF6345 domain-containing protein [Myxococcota bacterium]
MQPEADAFERLPIFRVGAPRTDPVLLHDLAKRVFGIESYELHVDDDRLRLRAGSRRVELHRASGGVYAADEAQRWNPTLSPRLPTEREARELADTFVVKNRMLPELRPPFSIAFTSLGGTHTARFDRAKKARAQRQLDRQACYAVRVTLDAPRGGRLVLPVVGGGGEFTVTVGDGGQVIAFDGVWRPVVSAVRELESPVVPRAEADERFKELTKAMNVRSFECHLAYYAAPASSAQEFLYPVYVYRAIGTVGKNRVPLRLVTLPATRFGPPAVEPRPQPKRARKVRPGAREAKLPRRGPQSLAAFPLLLNPFEAGTSWIGQSGGLGGSQNNAQGFVDGLAADGWLVNFNWGDANAWESDWRRNDDDWVDAADFVFYTGHASMDGWVLRSPDDGFMHWNEVGAGPASPGDLWGQQDLEWIVIAACGPLQDEILAKGGGDLFARWDGAFDGLHLLMGYGAITFDNEDEGRLVVKYAREGQTLINAWLRAAREVQPADNGAAAPDGPTIWAGVMWVERSGLASPANDHLWGHGSVAPDPTSPDTYVAMWTTT